MINLSTNSEIKIVIADDHPIFRSGLKMMIEAEDDLKVVAEADNGETALSHIYEHNPLIAVLDLDMPKMDGFAVVRTVLERSYPVEIIFLTMHNSESIFSTALDLGVKGYVLKDSALPEIIDCIRAILNKQRYISPQLSALAANRNNRMADFTRNNPSINDLTTTERRILKLITDDKTSRQIADELFISIRTVDRHRANISDKLNLQGANALLRFALAHKSEIK